MNRSKEPSWKRHSPHKNSLASIFKYILKNPFTGFRGLDKGAIFKKIALFCLLAAMFGSLILVAVFGIFASQLPDVNSILSRFVAQSTKIYDKTGKELLFELHGDQKRTTVELDQISKNIVNALISAEDKNFYEHKGFSIVGIARSAIKNLLTGSSVGGSTLTQQMIKNTVLTNEKTYTRKIKELILSREAEKNFSKDEILKIYLNTIGYGGVNYGVESASQAFFGKNSKEVSLAEAAVLAAIPQAPTRLSPYGRNVDQLLARKDWVLERMQDEGYITKDEMEAAKKEELVFKKQEIHNIKAPHFVFYVRELLAAQFGEDVVNQGGLKVVTTLDYEKQKFAEEAVTSANEFNITKGATNASLVSVDAKNGQILAMVGSQDYFNDEIDGKVNVSIEPRQPGSSIKPIVYAAAIDKGFTSETVVYDVNTNFAVSGKAYEPKNYNLQEHGPVTFRKALQGSLNIPAVKALYLAGVDNVMKKMENDLGYHTITKELDCGLSLVLGGCEVTLLDHVGAYTAFARDGEMAKPQAILEVYDNKGEKMFEFKEEKKTVWDSQVARTMNNILSDNEARSYVFGATSYLQLGARQVAAKTGTTNDYNDAWTIGYTPSFVTGVWVGNSDGTNMKSGADGSIIAAPIWNSYMKKMLGNGPMEQFKAPDPIPSDLPAVLKGDIAGEVEVEVDKFSGKLATEYTPVSAKEKRRYAQHHTILHYVNKNNPRGGAPSDPASADPAYQTWENAVQDWVKRDLEKRKKEAEAKGEVFIDNSTSGVAPTEFDDVHLPENTPNIRILSPSQNQIIEANSLNVQVEANANRGISRVEVYIDDQFLGTMSSGSLNGVYSIGNIATGFHTLKTIAFDDVDNSKESTLEINIKSTTNLQPNVSWISPVPNFSFTTSQFPIPINFNLSNTADISQVVVYVEPSSMLGTKTALATLTNITQSNLTVVWSNANAGNYNISAVITTRSGATYTSSNLPLVIN